jgi:hypothetical protein
MITRMDGRTVCERCGGSAHDLVSHYRGEMTVQCVYCLEFAKIFGYPPENELRPESRNAGDYVLKHGRYKGQSIAEVASSGQRGIEYLKILSKDSPKMTGIIAEYFDSRSAVSVQAAESQHEPHRSPSRDEAGISGSP